MAVAAIGGEVFNGWLRLLLVVEGEGREEMVVSCGGVNEVGPGLGAAHSSGGIIVRVCSLLGRVERPEPPPFLGMRVPNLRRVTAPRPPPNAAVPQ